MFGGSSEPAAAAPVQAAAPQEQSWNQNNCAGVAQNFTKCMDDNNGNMPGRFKPVSLWVGRTYKEK
jgi:hypothetical protein